MKIATAAVLLSTVLGSPAARPQTGPDFSGTWIMDPARSASAVQNEPITAQTLVIAQTATEVVVETKRPDKSQRITYRFGKPEAIAANGAANGVIAATCYWDGPKLVTEALGNVNDATVRTKAVHALDPTGTEMTVENLVIVEHGYTLTGTKNYGAGKDVYKKAP